MTTKFINATGKTEDAAVASALAQLGLDRDEVSVEILERARKGFLGIGASPAKVRVTYEVPEEAPKPARQRPAPKPAEKAAPVSAPAPQEERRPERTEKRSRTFRPRNERRERPPRPAEEVREPAPAPAAEPADPGEPVSDEKAAQITAFLTGLLERLECRAQIKVYLDPEGRYKVNLEGEKLGALIGRRGETLDAIQQLTNYCVNKGGDRRVRVHVDAENYRLKREQSLRHLAQKVAARVVKSHRNVTLEPMNAYERHVIHTALQEIPGVTTYSMGTDPNRRVIVAIDRTGTK